jgi:hypothetical protein
VVVEVPVIVEVEYQVVLVVVVPVDLHHLEERAIEKLEQQHLHLHKVIMVKVDQEHHMLVVEEVEHLLLGVVDLEEMEVRVYMPLVRQTHKIMLVEVVEEDLLMVDRQSEDREELEVVEQEVQLQQVYQDLQELTPLEEEVVEVHITYLAHPEIMKVGTVVPVSL